MNLLFSIIRLFVRFYWAKKWLIQNSKHYFFKYHILKIADELTKEHIYKSDIFKLKDAVNSDPFRNGIIDYFLQPNDYIVNSKDIAVALNMGIYAYSNPEYCLNKDIIDAAFYIMVQIKKRIFLDENLGYILSELGKDIKDIEYSREEIETILLDKKLVVQNYFMIYNTPACSEKITVYYPGFEQSWIDGTDENSFEISIYTHDVPKGFFLKGFDYESSN